MSEQIPTALHDLFNPPAFVAFGTVNLSGSPQVTPVWVSYDRTHVLINTVRGRCKARNAEAHPQVSVHYGGQPTFGGFTSADQQQKQTRIILKIAPHKVIIHG